jgi:hypothetical protein
VVVQQAALSLIGKAWGGVFRPFFWLLLAFSDLHAI